MRLICETALLLISPLLLITGCKSQATPKAAPTIERVSDTALPYPATAFPITSPLNQTPTIAPTPETITSPTSYYDDLGRKAQADLAARLKIPIQSIEVIRVAGDEFDASYLGCPAPWQTPLPQPAIISGQTIVLDAGGVRYTYHAHRGRLVFCGPW